MKKAMIITYSTNKSNFLLYVYRELALCTHTSNSLNSVILFGINLHIFYYKYFSFNFERSGKFLPPLIPK